VNQKVLFLDITQLFNYIAEILDPGAAKLFEIDLKKKNDFMKNIALYT
jgi:hypothetical protein